VVTAYLVTVRAKSPRNVALLGIVTGSIFFVALAFKMVVLPAVLGFCAVHWLFTRGASRKVKTIALVKVGALDSIAGGKTRPMMLWEIDEANRRPDDGHQLLPRRPASLLPRLKEYSAERQRREQCESLGFTTDCHPMDLHAESLKRFRLVKSSELGRHVGKSVLAAGMLTTSKPVHTAREEPMEFATFDDGPGLIECVLFPDVYRERGHVLFDQGPFIFRGKVEEEFGAVTLTITHLERLERMLNRVAPPA
jgi:DNA polymerase III alpha subunit